MTGTDIHLPLPAPACLAQNKVITNCNNILHRVVKVPGDVDIADHLSFPAAFYDITVLRAEGKILTARLTALVIEDI